MTHTARPLIMQPRPKKPGADLPGPRTAWPHPRAPWSYLYHINATSYELAPYNQLARSTDGSWCKVIGGSSQAQFTTSLGGVIAATKGQRWALCPNPNTNVTANLINAMAAGGITNLLYGNETDTGSTLQTDLQNAYTAGTGFASGVGATAIAGFKMYCTLAGRNIDTHNSVVVTPGIFTIMDGYVIEIQYWQDWAHNYGEVGQRLYLDKMDTWLRSILTAIAGRVLCVETQPYSKAYLSGGQAATVEMERWRTDHDALYSRFRNQIQFVTLETESPALPLTGPQVFSRCR